MNITRGGSNISVGLPDLDLLNGAFLVTAIAAGATCLIVDVAKVRSIVLASDLLMNRDAYSQRYIDAYKQSQK